MYFSNKSLVVACGVILLTYNVASCTGAAVSTKTQASAQGEFSYVASLVMDFGKINYICQGALITNRWILAPFFGSSAHSAILGAGHLINSTTLVQIYDIDKSVTSNSYYGYDTTRVELALLRLSEAINLRSNKITLPKLINYFSGEQGSVGGYNTTIETERSLWIQRGSFIAHDVCLEKVKDGHIQYYEVFKKYIHFICIETNDVANSFTIEAASVEVEANHLLGLTSYHTNGNTCPHLVVPVSYYRAFINYHAPEALWVD